jgi:HSP20 family molecular chaperone IbpA
MALFSPFFPVSRNDPFWDVFEDRPFNLQSYLLNAGDHQVNRANVSETETEYRVEVEVPGYQKSEINVEYGNEGRSLIVSGHHESTFEQKPADKASRKGVTVEEVPEDGEPQPAGQTKPKAESTAVAETNKDTTVGTPAPAKVWIRERTLGSFTRTFSLPGNLDLAKASAALEHGVLTVVIPKAAKHEPKKIAIS